MRFKFPFVLNESQRGAFLILLMGLICILGLKFISFNEHANNLDLTDNRYFQEKLDSLRAKEFTMSAEKYTYNPNYLSDYNAYRLGIPSAAYDRLKDYRASGKFMHSMKNFQKVTGVSDSLVTFLSPQLRFPNVPFKPKKKKRIEKQDLNTATAQAFQKISGIGPKLSERLVKYRNYLSGFSTPAQCYEVYGLDSLVVGRLLEYFEIQTPAQITPLSINDASLYELAKLPYISRQDAEKIVAYRTENNGITLSFLSELFVNYPNKLARIKLYLY